VAGTYEHHRTTPPHYTCIYIYIYIHIYWIHFNLGDRAKEGRGSERRHAGTREKIRKFPGFGYFAHFARVSSARLQKGRNEQRPIQHSTTRWTGLACGLTSWLYTVHVRYACVMKYVKHFWVGTKIMLGKHINTMFDDIYISTGSVIMMTFLFYILNKKMCGHWMYALANKLNRDNEGTWYDSQKCGNNKITGVIQGSLNRKLIHRRI